MKARYDHTQIAKLLDRHKSANSLELSCNRGIKGYRPKLDCKLTAKRSEQSRKSATVPIMAQTITMEPAPNIAPGDTMAPGGRCCESKTRCGQLLHLLLANGVVAYGHDGFSVAVHWSALLATGPNTGTPYTISPPGTESSRKPTTSNCPDSSAASAIERP